MLSLGKFPAVSLQEAKETRDAARKLLARGIDPSQKRQDGKAATLMAQENSFQVKCSQVFRYAVATGRADRDPTADLRGALKPVQTRHRAAIIDPARAGQLMHDIDHYSGTVVVSMSMYFTATENLATCRKGPFWAHCAAWDMAARK